MWSWGLRTNKITRYLTEKTKTVDDTTKRVQLLLNLLDNMSTYVKY
jgi:uncharacterized protein YeeX (DUF496 family)